MTAIPAHTLADITRLLADEARRAEIQLRGDAIAFAAEVAAGTSASAGVDPALVTAALRSCLGLGLSKLTLRQPLWRARNPKWRRFFGAPLFKTTPYTRPDGQPPAAGEESLFHLIPSPANTPPDLHLELVLQAPASSAAPGHIKFSTQPDSSGP